MEKAKKRMFPFAACCILAMIQVMGRTLTNGVDDKWWENIGGYFLVYLVLFVAVTFFIFVSIHYYNDAHIDFSEVIAEKMTMSRMAILLFLLYLPWLIIRYPALESGGVGYQIQMFLGMDTPARHMSNMIYEGHYITGHHPVLLTIFFGIFIKIGKSMGMVDQGMFFLSITICILNIIGWVLCFQKLKRILHPKWWTFAFFVFACNPFIASANTAVLKDNLLATLLALLSSVLMQLFFEPESVDFKGYLLILLLICFCKGQGIYIITIVNISLAIYGMFKNRAIVARVTRCMVISIFLYCIVFQHIVMPMFQIAPAGRQMLLGALFQQTSRVMVYHRDEIPEEEVEIIHKVLPIDDWEDSYLSNVIEFQSPGKFNQSASTKELISYYKVWMRQCLRYPKTYIEASALCSTGYWYIESSTYPIGWTNMSTLGEPYLQIDNSGEMISGQFFKNIFLSTEYFLRWCTQTASIKWMFNIPFAACMFVILLFLHKKGIQDIICFMPVFLQWLICLVSADNGIGRYGFIVIEMLPIFIAMVGTDMRDRREEKKYPVLFKEKQSCCGCSACYSICSFGAIVMTPDEEGFFYPMVNKEKCKRCMLCEKVCPIKH